VNDSTTFAAHYQQMSNAELSAVVAERESLTPEAIVAIDAELHRRGLSVAVAKKETKRAERVGTRREIGRLGFSFRGVGKHFFGASNYRIATNTATEEFNSTLWLWIMWLPIVPLASYHIERHERGKSLWWSLSNQPFSASNEAPPFFSHVILGWAFSIVAPVVTFCIARLLLELFTRH
jgi:hypothetical protein